jgi:ribosomal protein uS19
MEYKDFIELLPTRRRRYLQRSFCEKHVHLMEKLKKARQSVEGQAGVRPPVVKTHLRAMVVLPEFVENVIGIYDGRSFVEVQIRPDMIGSVFAEFAPSKKVVKHSKAGVGATRSSSATSLK